MSESTRSTQGAQSAQPRSVDQIEAEIAAARTRLADTVDELQHRTAPKEIVRRQVEGMKARLMDATHTPDGQLRTERVAALAALGAALIGLGVWQRRRS
jgi:hypothetical protein